MPTAAARAPVVVTARALPKGFPMRDVIEYVVIRGRRFCACSVAVLEMAEAGFKAAGIIPRSASIHDYVSQGGYRAGATAASKGSHDRGGVHDVSYSLVDSDADQRIWDQAGVVGCRRRSWEFTSTKTPDHGHIIAVGCPHLAEFAADQLAEIRRGGDGMAGTRKWAGPTPSFTPWRTRYAAFKAQQEEDDMPLTDSDVAKVAAATVSEMTSRKLGSSGPTVGVALQDGYWSTIRLQGEVAGLREAVSQLAGGAVDLAAIMAASKRGTAEALAGAEVNLSFPKEEQA